MKLLAKKKDIKLKRFKMKKILILFLLALAVFFTCCGKKSDEKKNNDDPNIINNHQEGEKDPESSGEGEQDPNPNEGENNSNLTGEGEENPNEGEKEPDPNGEGEKDPEPNLEDPDLTFSEDDFKYEIVITKCDNNYKKKITNDNYNELYDKIKDFTYHKYDQCTSCDTPLYTIAYNEIVITIYEYNFFKINDELFELTSGSFDFLSQFEYVDGSSSGWLPWI